MQHIRRKHNRTTESGKKVLVRQHAVNTKTKFPQQPATKPPAPTQIDESQTKLVRSGGSRKAEEDIFAMMRETFALPSTMTIYQVENPLPKQEMFFDSLEAYLRSHHALHNTSYGKEKFEDAIERIYPKIGVPTEKEARGHPGADVVVDGVRWTLKSEAGNNISEDEIFISKYMEMGTQTWTEPKDLLSAKKAFFTHMEDYERILTLRSLTPRSKESKTYELVEIPKELLLRAKNFRNKISETSRSNPKPGTCTVKTRDKVDFQLIFTGGTNRKLQIAKLRKELCVVHARWEFDIPQE